MKPNLRRLSGVGMNQMDLFEDQRRPGGTGNRDIPIRSGRVGTIRFGATETSFTVTRDALTDLAAPPADASEETS